MKKNKNTLGWKVIAFIHKYCKVPEGKLVGQPIILDKFQIEFILHVFDNKKITKKAILSMAKKNGKTALISCIVLAFLVGCVARQNSQIVSGAMSKDQAAIVFNLCKKMIELDETLSRLTKIVSHKKTIYGLRMNVEYKALSADAKLAHGLSPYLIIFDELGQVVGSKSDFYDALETAQGAHENPLMFIISTQAQTDSDLLSILIDDALEGKDPHTICHLYTADEGCDIKDIKQMKKANPALGNFRSIEDIISLADAAHRMPTKEATFRNLNLNQRVTTSNPAISPSLWKQCAGAVIPIEECDEIYGALDLSKRTDLTALVFLGKREQEYYAYPYFWMPADNLIEKIKQDRAPYDAWAKAGHIKLVPGKVIDYEFVAMDIGKLISDGKLNNLKAIGFDRWRMDVFKKDLDRLGISIELKEVGQGFRDMSPAIDNLERLILNNKLKHGGNPVLTMCAMNAVITQDAAENRKLDKKRTSGRIDGMQALAMAAGVLDKFQDNSGNIDEFLNNPIIA